MQEEMNLEQNAELYESIDAEEDVNGVTQDETIEYIDVQEQEPYVIEVEEAFASTVENDELNHALLTNRDLPGQHPIGAIDGLENILAKIQSLKNGLYASGGGLAEFRKWEDENPTWDNRSGYFVSIANGDGEIAICDKQVSDVYGVVVPSSAFCGYEDDISKVGNPLYAMVCLVGNVKVRIREESDIVAGDYVVADNYGHAIKSENNVGFRVLSVGTDPVLEYYASIALVPQNDNVSRVMEDLSATNGELSNVIIQLGKVEDALIEIEKDSNNAIEVAGDAKDLADILKKTVGSMGNLLDEATNRIYDTEALVEQKLNDVSTIYAEAVGAANDAKESANSALGDIADLQKEIKPLADWSDGEQFGIAGFVAQANSERTQIATLTTAMYGDSVDTIGVIQEIDRNEATLKHIVANADKYSVGPYSLSYKLTYKEACGILQTKHIYVATQTHTETSDLYICGEHDMIYKDEKCYFTVGDIIYGFTVPVRIDSNTIIRCNIGCRELTIEGKDEIYPLNILQDTTDMIELSFSSEYTYSFEEGKSYIWREDIDNPSVYVWAYNSDVYFNPPQNPQEDDLWFCLNGVTENNKYIYYPETLYRWDGVQWVSVATIDGNMQARAVGLVKQTANELTSTYTNLRGDVSVIKQDVNKISTTVAKVEGEISSINQTADSIIAGTFDPEGSSSLSMLLDYSFTAVSEGRYHKRINRFVGTTTVVGNRYSQPPSWSEVEGKFVFNDSYVSSEGKYYFNSDDQTTYCKDVNGGHEVYTIGNTAISALDSRVSETESEMASWTRFKTGTNETMTNISQTSSEDGADIASVVYGNYRQCVEIKTELTDEEKSVIPTDRYDKAPDYVNSAFAFDGTATTDGKYYMLDGDNTHYYKVINLDGEIIGYEKYTMKTSNYASIMQKVDENGSYIGLAAGNDDTIGSLFVNAINDKSEVLINADKIGINGTTVFSSLLNEGTTTINGNYIRSGVLESNNYKIPSETTTPFAEAGTKFDLDFGTINSKNFNIDANGNVDINGNIILGGSIVLDGSISWGTDNSPTKVLYSASSSTTPTKDTWNNASDSSTTWHKKYQSTDYYASYSYDGGESWTVAIRIRGKNGTNGEDGSDANVPDYIKETYIDFTTVQSPAIYGGIFKTHSEGTAYATMVNNEFAIYDVNDTTRPKASLGYDTNENKIKLTLGAGYQWTSGTLTQYFEIVKTQEGAEITYIDKYSNPRSINFSDNGITINGLTGVTAVFG